MTNDSKKRDYDSSMVCALCHAREHEPERIVYRNEFIFVLLNFEPIKDGHLMILPLQHREQLSDLSPEEAEAFLKAADTCMHLVKEVYNETPMYVVNGQGFRSQKHLHAHVLPSKHPLRGLYEAAEGTKNRLRAEAHELMRVADVLRTARERLHLF